MHTHILEQIATIESQINPAQTESTTKRLIQSKLSKLFEPSPRRHSDLGEYVYFLEPEIENIMAVIKNIPPTAEVVVLNSDVGHLGQICEHLNQPTSFKSVFIIRPNQMGKLQCWNIDVERARYVYHNQINSNISGWTIEADRLSYDYAVLRGECHMVNSDANMSAMLDKAAINLNAPVQPNHSNSRQ